ncbi:OmpA family protein [Cystobacter ferrugineus]|uniref:OmpA family protein n=1 Tax=Cystobacter ferrugineus TaxID=83449 RepID=UPI000A046730|nr:OmpA family protein [Cystobacter ferrugineus]
MTRNTPSSIHRAHYAVLALLLASTAGCTRDEPASPPTTANVHSAQPLFDNGSFEEGTLNGWSVATNLNPGITLPVTSRDSLNLQSGGTNYTFARRAAGGPETEIPAGLSAAASLRWPRYGQWAAVVNESGKNRNVNRLVQSTTLASSDVDPADGKVHVRFAIAPVLQAPNHTADQQPYFFISLRNVTRNTQLWSTFNFANQTGVPWKTLGDVQYTDWQAIDVAPGDARLAVGDTVELEVIAAGCQPGGHWGHVYVDGFGAFLPGLSIAASAPRSANVDSDLTYTYLVKNSGDGAVNNTQVTIVVPDQTEFVSIHPPPGATCNYDDATRTVTCDLGTLNPTASTQFDMKVHIDPTATEKVSHGNYNVQGQGVSPLIGPLVETTVSTGVTYADLAVSLSDNVVGVGWDKPVHYTLVASNNGPAGVTGASLDEDFPPELTDVTWTCTATGGATCPAATGTGPIHSTVDIPSGGKLTYSIDARVVPGSGSGTLVNRAQISPPTDVQDPNDTNNVAVDSNGIGTLATLTVEKDPTGGGQGTIVSSPTAIQCDVNCTTSSADFLAGTQVSLTATAAPGSVFVGWSGGCSGTANPCTVSVDQATTVTARFEPIKYDITTSSGPGGTITCPSPVLYGQSVTCTVTPRPGYDLSSLTDNGAQVSTSVTGGQYIITNVTGPHELSALFTQRPGTDQGGACTQDSECSTGLCADGVCCDTACQGQCEACNAEGSVGTCTAVTGAPQGGRPACGSDGTVCGGVCDGTVRDTCSYPRDSVQCGDASCSEGVSISSGTCNGAGTCTQETQSCGDYVCGEVACLSSCTSDAQCAEGSVCLSGECKPDSTLLVEGSGCSSTGGAGAGLPLLLSSLALWLRRRRSTVAAAAAAVATVPMVSQAQGDLGRSFLVQRFQAQPGRDDLLGVQSARVPDHLTVSGRLFVDYANQPLRLVSSEDSRYQRLIVGRQAFLTLAGSVALFDRFELGAAIPVLLSQNTGGPNTVNPRFGSTGVTTAISDLRLNLKTALVRSQNLGLSLSLPFSFPTAPRDSYAGTGSVTFNPTLAGEWRGERGSALMANVGLYLARAQQFYNLNLGTAITYGVGGKVDLVPQHKLALLATLAGEVGLRRPSVPTNPLELLLALRWGFLKNLEATVGGGPGLTNGYGTPRYRLLAALSYAPSDTPPRPKPAPVVVAPPPPPPPPPPAIIARDDSGQVLAGQSIDLTVLGNDEGQPGESLRVDEVGSAKEGRVEAATDGTLRYTARESFSGQDTFTYRVSGNDGRTATATVVVTVTAPPPPPPPAPPKVVVEKGKLRTLDKVYFAINKDNAITESLPILDQVYEVLHTNPDIKKLRVEAHTDNAGKASYNKDLSARRAKWVLEYLIQKGIAPERLASEGFGMTKPIDTNGTPEGRANNRRVEFVIVE